MDRIIAGKIPLPFKGRIGWGWGYFQMKFRALVIGCAVSIFLLYAILLFSLLGFFEAGNFVETLISRRVLFSIRLSLIAATIATILSVAIGLPAAYALSRYNFRGKQLIDTVLEIPMVLSPVSLGAVILIFFNTNLGEWVQNNMMMFVFEVSGIVLAQFVTTAGIATRLIKTSLDEIPLRYEAVARSLGATPLKVFLTVTIPLSKKGIIAAAILSWAKAIGEFGATIMVAGSMAMKTETIPIAIYMRLSSADITGTIVMIIILLVIGMSVLSAVRFLGLPGHD